MQRPSSARRILFIDSYDSFTYNLTTLLESVTGAEVHVIHNDTYSISQLVPFLPSFDAVVVGPGPGTPEKEEDIGVIKDLWHLPDELVVPVLGVCLGHQSLCLAYGAKLKRLEVVKHGMISRVRHTGKDLFEGLENVDAVRYHSLYVENPDLHQIEELAWADDDVNGSVLMAAKHRTRPYWGVQYHPESICTNNAGAKVMSKFWELAQQWAKVSGRNVQEMPVDWKIRPRPLTLLEQLDLKKGEIKDNKAEVQWVALKQCELDITVIASLLGVENEEEFVLLDSVSTPGRFSIVGSLVPGRSQVISYVAGASSLKLRTIGSRVPAESVVLEEGESIWSYLAAYMREKAAEGGPKDVPFWGGLVGYFNYEIGVASLDIPLEYRRPGHSRPDINLVFVERSVVIDKKTSTVYIQSILGSDDGWISRTQSLLQQAALVAFTPSPSPSLMSDAEKRPLIAPPNRKTYESDVNTCKDYLFAGESYELCYTASTTLPSPSCSPWALYTKLRTSNPAPYAAYIRLNPTTLLSSSPERFLSISRPPYSLAELRPIKGTLRKTPSLTLEAATAALRGSQKETAENLMILDLIRHDLHQFSGSALSVPKVMTVEEYASVYQMVSVVQAPLPDAHKISQADLLSKTLPPGSMTGAPKKRSVEILCNIEGRERGCYAGVLGYWDVGGGGDWSVVIRTAERYDDDGEDSGVWKIGAGGAVTALSDAGEEYEEMVTKLMSASRVFGEVKVEGSG